MTALPLRHWSRTKSIFYWFSMVVIALLVALLFATVYTALDTRERAISFAEDTLDELRITRHEFASERRQLHDQIDALLARVESLSQQTDELAANSSALEEQMATLRGQIVALQRQLIELDIDPVVPVVDDTSRSPPDGGGAATGPSSNKNQPPGQQKPKNESRPDERKPRPRADRENNGPGVLLVDGTRVAPERLNPSSGRETTPRGRAGRVGQSKTALRDLPRDLPPVALSHPTSSDNSGQGRESVRATAPDPQRGESAARSRRGSAGRPPTPTGGAGRPRGAGPKG